MLRPSPAIESLIEELMEFISFALSLAPKMEERVDGGTAASHSLANTAVTELGLLGDERAAVPLLELLTRVDERGKPLRHGFDPQLLGNVLASVAILLDEETGRAPLLAVLGDPATPPEAVALLSSAVRHRSDTSSDNSVHLPTLETALDFVRNPASRAAVVDALGTQDDQRTRALLLAVATDRLEDSIVRTSALARLGGHAPVDTVLRLLRHPVPAIRSAAASAAAHVLSSDRDALPSGEVRACAAHLAQLYDRENDATHAASYLRALTHPQTPGAFPPRGHARTTPSTARARKQRAPDLHRRIRARRSAHRGRPGADDPHRPTPG